jgi:dipeptide transport system substrate-binding protein
VQKAQTTTNVDDRTALYQKAQLIFKDQAPWLTIAHTIVTVPMQKKVSGFKIDPLGHFNFEGVDISG